MSQWKIHAFADEASNQIDSQIAAMKRNGLQGLEVRSVDSENVSSISLEKAAEVRAKMDDAGLKTWSIGSPIGKIAVDAPFEPHLDLLKHTLEVAKVLGADRIRMFSFYTPVGEQPEKYRNAVMERMGKMLDVAKDSGIALCHENEKGIYGDVAVRCKELLDAFPTLHGIFDPANFIQSGQDVPEAWNLLQNRIDYMHIKDALADGSVVPAGCGLGHIPEILASFHAHGGRCLTIEPHLKVFDGLKALEREGETSQVGLYVFDTNDQAFDVACNALRDVIKAL